VVRDLREARAPAGPTADGSTARVGDEALRAALAAAAVRYLPDWPEPVTPHYPVVVGPGRRLFQDAKQRARARDDVRRSAPRSS